MGAGSLKTHGVTVTTLVVTAFDGPVAVTVNVIFDVTAGVVIG
jgi:hypothetical protein